MRRPLWLEIEVRGWSWADTRDGLILFAIVAVIATAVALL